MLTFQSSYGIIFYKYKVITHCRGIQMNKTILLQKISVIAIVASIIFNIILLSTNVFNGTYTATIEGKQYSISFDKFSYREEAQENGKLILSDYGFYQYFEANSIRDTTLDHNMVALNSMRWNSSETLDRASVFCLKDTYNGQVQATYYCASAIFLQVLLLLIDVIAIAILIQINRKTNSDSSN